MSRNLTQPSVTITASAGPNGSIAPSGSVQVAIDSSQTFTISSNPGYHIENVLADGASVGATGSYTFSNVTSSHTISATFAVNTYTLTPSITGSGTISPGTAQTVNYNGTTVFRLSPAANNHIVNVTGTCSGTLSENSFTTNAITNNCTVIANFAIDTHVVTATASSGGSITPASATVNHGSTTSFTVTPNTGYHTVSVNGCSGSLSGKSYTTGPITADCTVSAIFAINIDTTPDPFTFTPQTGVALNTVITSNSITASGINAPAPLSITGGMYSINGGTYTSAAGTVNNGDTIAVSVTSSSSYSTTTSATLTIGGVSATFNVTTVAGGNSAPIAAIATGYPQQSFWTVTVKDASTDPDGNLGTSSSAITVQWGNGSYSRCAPGGTVSYTYTVAGNYTISLIATDEAGLTSTPAATASVTISLGTVTGTVKNASGNPVNLAKVTITVPGAVKTAYTNSTGVYTISNVQPGTGYPMAATSGTTTFATQAWVTSGVVGTVNSGTNTVNFTP